MSRNPTASTGRVDYCTPADIIERALYTLDADRFDLDPASNPGSIVPANVSCVDPARAGEFGDLPDGFYYQDGLEIDWHAEARDAWSNPPYDRSINKTWAQKIGKEGKAGLPLIVLVPVATSEQWWAPYWEADQLAFIVGRLKHVGEKHGATFAQAVCAWNVHRGLFREAFEEIARIR